jgi:ankyrin repeat protein
MIAENDWFAKERLHFAARDGNVEKVRELLSVGYDPNAFDELSKTPLHYAAEREHIAVMNVLIEAGADVNAHELAKIGNTPLREVAEQCSYEVAKVLIDACADPTIPGWMQITALDLSKKRLKSEGKRVYALLHKAVQKNRIKET